MTDPEQILLKQLDRGVRAKRLLEDEMFVEAFASVEEHVLQMIKTAPLRDEEGVIKAKYMLHLLSLVKGAVSQVAQTGRLAELELERRKRGVTDYLGDIWRTRQRRR